MHLGPVTLAWHGLTTALGVLLGAWVAARVTEQFKLSTEPLTTIALIAVVGGLLGGRLLYLAENGQLLAPPEWLSTRGFSFNGGLALAAAAIVVYVVRRGLSRRYLDAIAVGLSLGVAVGRIGDVINGEHYGPPSQSWLAVRNSHPDASVPSPMLAYHSGGLYDLLLGLMIFALVWPLRCRLRHPTDLVALVLVLFGAGRFAAFFARSDSTDLALGLASAQWTSLGVCLAGAAVVSTTRLRIR